MNLRSLLILVIFISSDFSVAQNYDWLHFDKTNSGLPTNTIRCVTQDSSGIYWIGTWDAGLVRFDGKEWEVFNNSNSPLPHNCVYSIAFDSIGKIYIGTMGGGLAIFDGNSEWKIYNEKNSGIPQDWIYSVAVDKKNKIWVGTFSNGLGVYDGNTWTIYDKTNSVILDNKITYIDIDQNDNKIIATQAELAFIIDNKWYTEKEMGIDSLNYVAYWISKTKDGRKIISYKYDGLVFFDGKTFAVYNKNNSHLPIEGFYSAVEDNMGKVWAGSFGEGIVIFDYSKWIVWNKSNSQLKDDFVFNIFVDSKNNKWISTYFGGVSVYNENGVSFPQIK